MSTDPTTPQPSPSSEDSAQAEPKQKGFLRENWPWIVVPAVIFLVLIAVLLRMGGEGSSPFIYNIFG